MIPDAFTIFDMDTKDSLTILISFATLIVTIIVNLIMQIYWNRRKLAADLKSKSRIEWIQTVRKHTAELLSTYYRVLAYEKPEDYKIVQKPDTTREIMMKALNKEFVPIEHKPVEENKKELLAIAREKTQLLMLYYGFEVSMDVVDYDEDKAKARLTGRGIKRGIRRLCFWIDENDGKNQWMSSLLNDTYTMVQDAFDDDEDLNIKIKKAGKEHSKVQDAFIQEASRAGLMYDNVKAEIWEKGEENNKTVDRNLLKAKNKLNTLNYQKKRLYKRMDIVRESTSTYLKHEWDRAKKGK